MPQFQIQGTTRSTQQAPSSGRQQIISNGTSTALMGVADFTNKMAERHEELQKKEASQFALNTQSNLQVEWAKERVRLKQESKTGSDYISGVTKFFESKRSSLTDSAPNKQAAALVGDVFSKMQTNAFTTSVDDAAGITAQNAVDSNEKALNVAKTSVYLDPSSYEEQAANIATQIDGSQIPEASKDKVLNDQLQDLRRSQVVGLISSDPYQAASMLQENIGLDSEDHQALYKQAVVAKEQQEKTSLAMQARADKQAKELQEKIQSNTAKDGDELVTSKSLTPDWLNQNRDNLSESDFRYFNRQIAGQDEGPKTSDPNTFVDLDTRARNGENIQSDARSAFINGQITKSDYTSIINRADQESDLPSSYKQGERYLSNAFKPSELNPTVGSQIRYANVMDEFNKWYEANPSATPDMAVEFARKTQKRYQLVDIDKKTQELLYGPAPLYLSGSRQKPDIGKTAIATKRAYDNGEMSQQEYQREKVLINKWNALQNETKQGDN